MLVKRPPSMVAFVLFVGYISYFKSVVYVDIPSWHVTCKEEIVSTYIDGVLDMGLFTRFSDIVQAEVNALLDKAEDPKKMVRMMVQEIDAALVTVRSEAAKFIAEQKRLQREQQQAKQQADEWLDKAEKAVAHGRDDLAKQALQQQHQALQGAASRERELSYIAEQIQKLDQDISTLQTKASQARARQQQLEQRLQVADVRLQAKKVLSTEVVQDAMAKYDRYEARVEALEAEVDAYDLGQKSSLQAEFDKLEQADELDQALNELKQKHTGKAATPASKS